MLKCLVLLFVLRSGTGPHMHAHAAQSHAHAGATLQKPQPHGHTCAHMHTVRRTVACTAWTNPKTVNAHARTCRRVEDSEREEGGKENRRMGRRRGGGYFRLRHPRSSECRGGSGHFRLRHPRNSDLGALGRNILAALSAEGGQATFASDILATLT